MFARMSVKSLLAVLAALPVIAGTAPIASAQGFGYPETDRWYEPRLVRPVPQAQDPYDNRDEQSDDQSDERQWGRGDDDRRYRNRGADNAQRIPRRDYWRDDDQYDGDSERRDTAREPSFDDDQGKVAGADGGPRPDIQPLAPPRVSFGGGYAPGSIVIDTSARKLYYVTGLTSAFAYPIGVGREGFSWTGSEKISRIADWPDWYPPAEMRQRKPELPERMLGGIRNPLGVKAMYLGNTLYRIHGTNDPKSIGKAESSGCFRMLNANVLHLASLAGVGTQVTIVRSLGAPKVAAKPVAKPRPIVERVQPPRPRSTAERVPQPRYRYRDSNYYYDRGYYR